MATVRVAGLFWANNTQLVNPSPIAIVRWAGNVNGMVQLIISDSNEARVLHFVDEARQTPETPIPLGEIAPLVDLDRCDFLEALDRLAERGAIRKCSRNRVAITVEGRQAMVLC